MALAREGVTGAIADACAQAGVPGVDAAVVAGNTAMLTLLSGRDPRALATAPFITDCLFGLEQPLGGIPAYLPPCAAAFMGADLTCAALATGLCEQPETTLLMDIGTNGELMLWHAGRLYAASAAAGPAFEGGEISQGLGGVVGAIDRVWAENGTLGVRVIGGKRATGVCGSGLMDAVAALLTLGRIDPSGASDAPAKVLYLLHGASDDETIWQRRTSIERYAAPLGLAVVMPAAQRHCVLHASHASSASAFAR